MLLGWALSLMNPSPTHCSFLFRSRRYASCLNAGVPGCGGGEGSFGCVQCLVCWSRFGRSAGEKTFRHMSGRSSRDFARKKMENNDWRNWKPYMFGRKAGPDEEASSDEEGRGQTETQRSQAVACLGEHVAGGVFEGGRFHVGAGSVRQEGKPQGLRLREGQVQGL